MKDAAMRIGLYARVSSRNGARQDTENQLSPLREFCGRQGWEIVAEYVDRQSAKTGDRPQFKRLFADASQRKFDLLLFWSLDRLSREGVSGTLRYLETLTSYGVEWKSFTEQYLDSAGIFKDAVLAILATLAKQERIRISERTLAGLERARAKGKRLGRPPGVDSTRQRKAAQLRRAGKSITEIAVALSMSRTHAHRLTREARRGA